MIRAPSTCARAGPGPLSGRRQRPQNAPRWSPDGARVLFTTALGGDLEIAVVSLATGVVTPLTSNTADDVGGVWRP